MMIEYGTQMLAGWFYGQEENHEKLRSISQVPLEQNPISNNF